ncbi:hypothetical protein A3A09_03500 [Candidatus Nomurabacteria bacterium RIFCSPLOWO2_01_FULL_42_20]|uniref:Uncharacterized protein n=1 Tax=Candidatus Nomurabacteria bacterium RIFCSPHIGHO2_01_FULL_42_16 TaxID=1801743 RepID=A0A1F6VLH7_9BACT|nr:MAG: hypothetical protein A2824_01020 [Candidatus Nomurabacteria bacterium RIFCSPHIGHO2_01_FULL_42_16]OGI92233.1 MAG: hypothetical protein A3A09_03500 [Candidatus Nomurabacteria bacterium RIFCSPLOWO2_01_FULL_42_20]
MHKLINKVRNKPEPVRRHIILIVSLAITGIIVLFWVFTLPYRFSGSKEELKKSIKPFELLKQEVSNTITGIGDTIR